MNSHERNVINKAKSLGAKFKRDGKTRWMWEGVDYSYETRLDAAYEYLAALNLTRQESNTATP